MRKTALLFLTFAFAFLPGAFAQKQNELSVFVSDISGLSNTFEKTHWYGGVGLAFNKFLNPRVSAQLAVAAEQHRSYPYVVDGPGGIQPVPSQDRYSNHLNPQLVGEVEFLIRPSIGITLDGKQLLGDRETYDRFSRFPSD